MEFASQQRKERDVWLAMRFGCCASRADGEDREVLRENGESQMQIIYDQPQTVQQPRAEPIHHPRPSTSRSMSRHVSQWVDTSRDFATRASSRASFSTLTRPRRSQSGQRARPRISQPMNLQHDNGFGFDGIQSMVDEAPMPLRRNRSLRRLELSIYLPSGCGRLSPLPDFEDEEVWTAENVDLEMPEQALVRERDSRTSSLSSYPSTSDYLIQRKPVGSSTSSAHSRRSSTQSQKSNGTTTTHERRLSGTTMATMQTPTLSAWPEEPASASASQSFFEKPSVRRSLSGHLSPARVLSRLPSPSRNRANTAPSSRPGSLRRARTDVDEAIRELNTIVEERRASAYRSQTLSPELIGRPPPSPSHHVPYIAPSMRMHVREETLSDIGSAFSAPSVVSPNSYLSPTVGRTTRLTLSPPSRNSTMALCSNPITPPAPATPTSITRLATWLKRSLPSTSTTPTTPAPNSDSIPFYNCAPTPSPPSTSHTRQDSAESNTDTVTLYSLSSQSSSPAKKTKTKRVPAPLVLAKQTDMHIEVAMKSGRSLRDSKPPMSPHVNLLRGMEISARDVGVGRTRGSVMPSPGAVGVAF